MGIQENVPKLYPSRYQCCPSPQEGPASMLFVYSRHAPECAHKDEIKYRRCRCPKWIDGYVDGKRVRQSAKTRNWEQAERQARLWKMLPIPRSRPGRNDHRRRRRRFHG